MKFNKKKKDCSCLGCIGKAIFNPFIDLSKPENKPKHNYKVGDKVVIVEDIETITQLASLGVKSAIGQIGTIFKISETGADITLPYGYGLPGLGYYGWSYLFNQFKLYVEEQKPEFKFKVGDVIEHTDVFSVALITNIQEKKYTVRVIHDTAVEAGRIIDWIYPHQWKLYEYGVGDEVLFNKEKWIVIDCFLKDNKLGLKIAKGIIKYSEYCFAYFDEFTLIKSARWTRENEPKPDDDSNNVKPKPKIKWEKLKTADIVIHGYINNKLFCHILVDIYYEKCKIKFQLSTEDDEVLKRFKSLKKAKEYALKHYLEYNRKE